MKIQRAFPLTFATAFLLLLHIGARAELSELASREQALRTVRSELKIRPEQFLSIKRDEELEQSLSICSPKSIRQEFIYMISSVGYEKKNDSIVHHFATDGDLSYIVAVSPVDGHVFLLHGFSESLSELNKLIASLGISLSGPVQAEAIAYFYRSVNPENRSIAAIENLFELKQAAERQCQRIPFEAGDREFESWWKKARMRYGKLPFDETSASLGNAFTVQWIVLSNPDASGCAGFPLRAELEIGKGGQIGKLTFSPLGRDFK